MKEDKKTLIPHLLQCVYIHSTLGNTHMRAFSHQTTCTCFMRDEKEEERSKQGQTNNKAKQHSTPKAVKKNELPQVGHEPTTLHSRQSVECQKPVQCNG